MYLPPVRATDNQMVYVSGDVKLDESAAIAPGVILQASPNSQLIVSAGVSIGMGAIVQAHQGTLTIAEGATLGAGVLAIGSGTIGANACLGAATTVLNPAIAPGQIVPAGSILGDRSRQWSDITPPEPAPTPEPAPAPEPVADDAAKEPDRAEQPSPAPPSASPTATETETNLETETQSTTESTGDDRPSTSDALRSGQEHISRFLFTLFPHSQPPNPSDGSA
ncbi:carbon dioxide concentrating mechanism protein [Oxynema sp. CENA135]|uniref:carbon dioxide concentrating mechanism protein n=1 Tax=Oxynema sp. CENA135 TaxID=984206 RepID=UPI00190BF371|nr:carbon dioxide concentrating mechanism protein [Oxynema sp. CENA135]MBK4731749.1 carbon dioxide concentrating mechanism protein [Oxynema sp. CENA135]